MFRSFVGRVFPNSSAVLNLGFNVRGYVYFSLEVVKMVAVMRHLVQGYLALLIGVAVGIVFGLGLMGSRSAVFAAWECFCGPAFLLMFAKYSLFRICVWRSVVRNCFAMLASVSFRSVLRVK